MDGRRPGVPAEYMALEWLRGELATVRSTIGVGGKRSASVEPVASGKEREKGRDREKPGESQTDGVPGPMHGVS